MNSFWDVFQQGFKFLFMDGALAVWTLLISLFAILKYTDIQKGVLSILLFTLGVLVNLLLLSFKIFALGNFNWIIFILSGSIIFSIWNFTFKSERYRNKGQNFSSRYLVLFILGLLHGIFLYTNLPGIFSKPSLLGNIGFWLGFFSMGILILLADYLILWLFINILRIKELDWVKVISGIAIGISITLLLRM